MSDNKINASVVDIGKLSDPIGKLIDAVANATEVVYEPTRILRKAKAEADALVILADSHGEIAQRAAKRLASQELNRQKNIDSVIVEAIDKLPDQVEDDDVDQAWMSRFLEDVQDISDEELLQIWSKVLAGEITRPGSFSVRLQGDGAKW